MMNLQLSAEDSTCVVRASSPVYDFGTVLDNQGPVSCEFALENVSSEPVCILNVVSSCGCTKAKWPRNPLKPGETGVIRATFSNDEGPVPFDKVLTVSTTGTDRLLFLHMTGNVIRGLDDPDSEYCRRVGLVRLKDRLFELGHLLPSQTREGRFTLYNPGRDTVLVEISSPGGNISVMDDAFPVPPRSLLETGCSLTASCGRFGRFSDSLCVRSRRISSEKWKNGIVRVSYTVDSPVSSMDKAPLAELSDNHIMLGLVSRRKPVEIPFSIFNRGESPLNVFNIESQSGSGDDFSPITVLPGESADIAAVLDVRRVRRGKQLLIIDIYTDSALQPVQHIYVTYSLRPSVRSLFSRGRLNQALCRFFQSGQTPEASR